MKEAIWLIAILLLSACSFGKEIRQPCQPPDDFTESDLVGTWWAGYRSDPKRNDFLEIRADGTYKQTIQLEVEDYEYKSDWMPWHLEYLDNGTIYLLLTDYRLYAFNPNLIAEEVIGGGDGWFVDFCMGESPMLGGQTIYSGIQMPPGEGVLIVMNDPGILGRAPRGIFLALLPVSDVSSWSYELIVP